LRREILNDRLTFTRKLDQSLHVIELTCYLAIKFEALFEASALLENLAGAFLIGPEVWFRNVLL
jgi:hypothetical protein